MSTENPDDRSKDKPQARRSFSDRAKKYAAPVLATTAVAGTAVYMNHHAREEQREREEADAKDKMLNPWRLVLGDKREIPNGEVEETRTFIGDPKAPVAVLQKVSEESGNHTRVDHYVTSLDKDVSFNVIREREGAYKLQPELHGTPLGSYQLSKGGRAGETIENPSISFVNTPPGMKVRLINQGARSENLLEGIILTFDESASLDLSQYRGSNALISIDHSMRSPKMEIVLGQKMAEAMTVKDYSTSATEAEFDPRIALHTPPAEDAPAMRIKLKRSEDQVRLRGRLGLTRADRIPKDARFAPPTFEFIADGKKLTQLPVSLESIQAEPLPNEDDKPGRALDEVLKVAEKDAAIRLKIGQNQPQPGKSR